MDFFFGDSSQWMHELRKRIRIGLDFLRKEILGDNEIYCFLEYLVAQHVYDASPQRLDENFSDVFTHRIMEFDRYMTICHSLCTDPQFAQSGNSYRFVAPGDKIVCLQSGFSKLSTQLQALAFNRGTTNIVLDDHKIHNRGTDAQGLGISTSYQRNGQRGPTLYMSTSKYTDILLSTGLETKDNMNGFELIKSVTQNAINPNCTSEAFDMTGTQINVDRGVMGKQFILHCTSKNAIILGTCNAKQLSFQDC